MSQRTLTVKKINKNNLYIQIKKFYKYSVIPNLPARLSGGFARLRVQASFGIFFTSLKEIKHYLKKVLDAKTIFKFTVKLILVYFSLLFIFLISLILSCLIPSSSLKNNIGKSIETLKKEGTYPSYGIFFRQIVLDNFTDSLILNTAYSVDSKNPLKSALLNYRYEQENNTADQILNLEKLYLNKEIKKVGYERYWHGYLIYLRPLLSFFSYSQIRVIISFFLYSLFLIFFYLSWRKLGPKFTLSFTLGLIAVDFFYLGQSLQFSSVFFIGLISSIYCLLFFQPNTNFYLLFFIVGGLTSFFDLLTAPLVSLSMPLVITIALEKKNRFRFIYYSFFWLLGYSLLWSSKWIIDQLTFAPSAITTALNIISDRTFHQADQNFSHLNAVKLNVFHLLGYHRLNKIIVFGLFIFFLMIFIKFSQIRKEKIKKIIPFILLGFLPYLWYLFAANHSYLHVWYTYRNQFITITSLFLIWTELVNWPKKSAKKSGIN